MELELLETVLVEVFKYLVQASSVLEKELVEVCQPSERLSVTLGTNKSMIKRNKKSWRTTSTLQDLIR